MKNREALVEKLRALRDKRAEKRFQKMLAGVDAVQIEMEVKSDPIDPNGQIPSFHFTAQFPNGESRYAVVQYGNVHQYKLHECYLDKVTDVFFFNKAFCFLLQAGIVWRGQPVLYHGELYRWDERHAEYVP